MADPESTATADAQIGESEITNSQEKKTRNLHDEPQEQPHINNELQSDCLTEDKTHDSHKQQQGKPVVGELQGEGFREDKPAIPEAQEPGKDTVRELQTDNLKEDQAVVFQEQQQQEAVSELQNLDLKEEGPQLEKETVRKSQTDNIKGHQVDSQEQPQENGAVSESQTHDFTEDKAPSSRKQQQQIAVVSELQEHDTEGNAVLTPPDRQKEETAPAAPRLSTPPSADKTYKLKPIIFIDPRTDFPRRLKIITQNHNGPCPLLALCNVLLLRGDIDINSEREQVDYEYLVELLGDWLTNRLPANTSSTSEPSSPTFARPTAADFSQNLTDVLELIPTLQTGLDVNVRFESPFAFELTPSLLVFDQFKITLCHGWTVDPQDTETHRVLVKECGSYNRVVEKIIEGDIAASEKAKDKGKGKAIEGDLQLALQRKEQSIHDGLVCKEFLGSTASQLTYHGLQTLCESLPPNSLSVLFRNNHFSTLFKRVANDGKMGLYTLVTDQGYAHATAMVWETMDNIDGDSTFVDGGLKSFEAPKGSLEPMTGAGPYPGQRQESVIGLGDFVEVGGEGGHGQLQVSADMAYALALQEEENQKYLSSQENPQGPQSRPHSTGGSPKVKHSSKKKEKCLLM